MKITAGKGGYTVAEIVENLRTAQPKYERWTKQGINAKPALCELLSGAEVIAIRYAIQWTIEENDNA